MPFHAILSKIATQAQIFCVHLKECHLLKDDVFCQCFGSWCNYIRSYVFVLQSDV